MLIRKAVCTLALTAALLSGRSAMAETVLRIGMTASDIPTATGMPNNGFEGMRFLGYPVFEGLVLWDSRAPIGWRRCGPGSPNNGSRCRTTRRPGCFTFATA